MPSARIHGRFLDVGIPIRVRRFRGSGPPEGIAGQEHSHDFTELLVFHGGRGVHRVDGRDYPVEAGAVFVVQGAQTHALVQRDDLQWTEVHYNASRFGLPTEHLGRLPGYHALFVLEPQRRQRTHFEGRLQLPPTRLAEALRIVAGMDREYAARPPGYEAMLVSGLLELIVFLSRQYGEVGHGAAASLLRVGEVVSLLECDYRRSWRLEELCQVAGMSKSQFEVVFREATGHTPIEYLIHVRLRHVMQLLTGSRQSVTAIAQEVGFCDSNYLARKFREVVGMSPVAYRRTAS